MTAERRSALIAWSTLLFVLVGGGVLAVLLVAYVKKVDQESEARSIERDQQICGIIVILDDRNRDLPPSSDPATTAFRDELHSYRIRLGC